MLAAREKTGLPRATTIPTNILHILIVSLLLAFPAFVSVAAEPAPSPPPALTAEQRSALDILDAMLARFDELLAKVPDARVKNDTQAVLDGLKARRDVLRQTFDAGRYEELKLDVNTESQRVAMWLAPLRTPPRTGG